MLLNYPAIAYLHPLAKLFAANMHDNLAMAPLDDTTAATRFDSFDVHRTSYKKIGDHNIEVGILIPKDIKPGKHPVIVKFHGGGLVKYPSSSKFLLED